MCPRLLAAFPLACLLIAGLLVLPSAADGREDERAVLVIIDGLRYSEGLGDPDREHVPRMDELAQQGAIVEPFLNDGITYTSRAIPALWCGAWTEVLPFDDPDCGWSENNYTELPTSFEYYRKQLDRPAEDCVYVLKDVGCPWRASFHPDYGPDFWPLYHSVGSSDLDVWHQTLSVLNTDPHFLLVYLADVDHAGHSGDWDDYIQAIETADSIVGMIWTRLQQLPSYAGRTTMLVTNDHGRHDWNFSGHGDDCDGCRNIQLLAVGPAVRPGFVSANPRAIPDVAPTLGALMGFATEHATGEAMAELFHETGVGDIPASGAELRAWPNPFSSRTVLRFSPPSPGSARLEVFDVRGRLVATPFDGDAAGPVAVDWIPMGDDGPLPSGVYLLRLSGREYKLAGSVVLLR